MTRRLFRISRIVFKRMQVSPGKTLSQGLKGDDLWMSLSGREHQIVGKTIARYYAYFAENCPIPVRVNYKYTDNRGNGIYG